MASMPIEQIKRFLVQASGHPRRNLVAAATAALLLLALIAIGPVAAAALAVGLIAGVLLAAGVGMPDSDATPAASVDPLPNPALIRHDEPDASITWRGIVEAVPNPVVAVDHAYDKTGRVREGERSGARHRGKHELLHGAEWRSC